jgi:hypothetical protein
MMRVWLDILDADLKLKYRDQDALLGASDNPEAPSEQSRASSA